MNQRTDIRLVISDPMYKYRESLDEEEVTLSDHSVIWVPNGCLGTITLGDELEFSKGTCMVYKHDRKNFTSPTVHGFVPKRFLNLVEERVADGYRLLVGESIRTKKQSRPVLRIVPSRGERLIPPIDIIDWENFYES